LAVESKTGKKLPNSSFGKASRFGDHPTIADIACFPYIALAGDGKISLDDYPNVVKWIDRVKQLPKYIGMPGL
jgi:glutathione S-transferase